MLNKIIILNGPSSCGKTSIIEEIVHNSDNLIVRLGIDLIWSKLLPKQYIMFNEKSHLGMSLYETENGLDTKVGELGKKITESLIKSINIFYNDGFDIIIDDIILTKYDMEKYLVLPDNSFFIGMHCDIDELIKREIYRNDRPLGLSAGQVHKVHNFQKYYDFTIDTTDLYNNSNRNLSKEIMDFIKNNIPTGLKKFKLSKNL